jgi:type VI protein secretion system component VasK
MFDRAQAIATIEAGRCACPGCRGQLTSPGLSRRGWRHCQLCRCAWKAEAINGIVYASSIEGLIHTRPRVPNRQLTDADYDGHEDLR